MAIIKGKILIDIHRCKGCGLCVENCPLKILALQQKVNHKGYRYVQTIKATKCIGCANCGYVCPDSCITVYKEKERNDTNQITIDNSQ